MAPLRSWFPIPPASHFSLANIPFGIISTTANPKPRLGVPIGDHVLDLALFTANNGFARQSTIQPHQHVFSELTLNSFAALGRPVHSVVRKYIQDVFLENTSYPEILKDNAALQKEALVPLKEVTNHLPLEIGDYTDFFVGRNHAYNCGILFRGPENPIAPNYDHLPVGYHGRASSVVVSGTPIRRPFGQIEAEKNNPIQSPCLRLDFEMEMGAFVCKANKMGEPILIDEAEDAIFGLVMMNDWSARDIQFWESTPLGPFNSKNFGTSVSPWVVLIDALEPFAAKGLPNAQQTLPYMQQKNEKNQYDIKLKVDLTSQSGQTATVCKVSATELLFSFPQMVAHHTIGGCPMRVGDLLGSGTISGNEPGSCGCFLESTQGGKVGITLSGGEKRMFLEDGDTVTFSGVCGTEDGGLVGFGECSGTILPALKL
ncbi:Fumarylacetoacetase [Rhizodiscina lignyota]|uniref:Fumarylacetoacetase n=1 Tax=Rhizodiscina lignyota TaxID=1504668 RepID=A0A9P4I501_9PEZI|nr:Fumarylacetoacetase [Rhizodiscina lignyota]